MIDTFVLGRDSRLDLSRPNFIVVGHDDTTENDTDTVEASNCMDQSDQIGPILETAGAKVSGWIVLDTEFEHGALLLTHLSMGYGGWE